MPVGAFRKFKGQFAASLRTRVLILTLSIFVAVGVPACLSFVWIVNSTVLQLGTLFAEKQILYDRYRGLGALTREVALAETLARSPAVLDWADDETDPAIRGRGIAELEHFRQAFNDRSYFFVIARSGNYYFNDRDGQYADNQLRYTLRPDNPRDGWYYKTVAGEPGCQLNVDNDDVLGVTKVWINCVVEKDGRVLGVLGTGIDLSVFIRTVVNSDQSGIESMFVDRGGAVQANRDARRIDFHSLTKDTKAKKTVFQMIDREADRAALSEMMDSVRNGDSQVAARFLSIGGQDLLVGIGYLDRLGWYNVTLMDVDQIIDRRLFLPIAALLAAMMATAAALVAFLFKRTVLDRLARAEMSIAGIEAGDFSRTVDDRGSDEIGRLARALNRMAGAVRGDRETLEAAVRERTERLERIAYIDSMTGILNRRAAAEAFDNALKSARGSQAIGFLLFDIDHFKEFNDCYGHRAGDAIVAEVAARLLALTGAADFCARWGGDEFVVILPDCDRARLEATVRLVHLGLVEKPVTLPGAASVRITASLGAHLGAPGDTLDAVAHRADVALYRAKRDGRDRAVIFDPAVDRIDQAEIRAA